MRFDMKDRHIKEMKTNDLNRIILDALKAECGDTNSVEDAAANLGGSVYRTPPRGEENTVDPVCIVIPVYGRDREEDFSTLWRMPIASVRRLINER